MSMLWTSNEGYLASPKLSDHLMTKVQPMTRFRQFGEIEEAIGKNRGEKFNWTVFGDLKDQGGRLSEDNPIPETEFDADNASVVITEWGLSVPYTGKLNDLSEKPVTQIINKQLKNDCKKVLDTGAWEAFERSPVRMVGQPNGEVITYRTGKPEIINDSPLSIDHIQTIVDDLEESNVPPIDDDGNYVCIARPKTFRPFRKEWEKLSTYVSEGYTRIINGEKGRYEGVRFVSQTNIPNAKWKNGKSDRAYFIGADAVAEAVAIPEEIRGKIPDDYGRGHGIAWYALLEFALCHPAANDARVYVWDSLETPVQPGDS
ncbi:hypothetical protein KCM76_22995 [Zooshikella marina]|uniref:hypothetical protein n=1 Tax=Zooshikella ganghwensis TaxID=202772 RepID=UPI001BAEBE06|nr:hypothetical protein [Zooshikella ganghwensis]MBU2708880.1 hypothetical protein [Zooshikella ganghwensis]